MKRVIPTVAIVSFLLGALAVALVAAPHWRPGYTSPAAARTSTATPGDGKAQAACDAFLKDFADRLGVSQDKVKTSLKASIDDAIDRAVKNGHLTATQATRVKARVDAVRGCEGLPAFGKRFGHPGKPGGMRGLDEITNAAATALGTTPADLRTAVIGGKTLHDVAGAGISQADFDTRFRAALTAELQPQVDAGKLSADQAHTRVDQAARLADALWDVKLKDALGDFAGIRGHAGPFR